MKMRLCKMCKSEKSLIEFGTRLSSKDGLNYNCKTCCNETSRKRYKNRDIRQQALTIYRYMNKRCNNKEFHKDRPKYVNIENKINKEEFIFWYSNNYFEGCEVDRIKDDKDYSIENIQLLSKEEHNHKRKLERDGYLDNGFRRCNKCKAIKIESKENFGTHIGLISQFNIKGFRGICKECSNRKQRKNKINKELK